MSTWPNDTRHELESFYGKHRLGPEGVPTGSWEREFLTLLPTHFPMILAWDPTISISRIKCHRRVADSLETIFGEVLSHFDGDLAAIAASGVSQFGGCYNYRPVRGNGSKLSTHAWGAGIDLDPARNPLGRAWRDDGKMMPKIIIEIFEDAGWTWGGRWTSRPDCMHFQATRSLL